MYISKEGSTSIRIDVFFRGVGGCGLFFNVVIFFYFVLQMVRLNPYKEI